ncbi:hypothetical protein KC19_4G204200 [Ceratodon purpureus]|uniref:Secreted protein n=1 Tax=Ceratodon purpureus TaxID=3225 RepID=A0A8T0IBP8_CERPU|nr:hypothetical protein KC19_4G204200 [Ceratodon purpureus]
MVIFKALILFIAFKMMMIMVNSVTEFQECYHLIPLSHHLSLVTYLCLRIYISSSPRPRLRPMRVCMVTFSCNESSFICFKKIYISRVHLSE